MSLRQPAPAISSDELDDVQSAAIDVAADQAAAELIAAPGANKQIWVYALDVGADIAGTVKLLDSTPTDKTGSIPVGATGGRVWGLSTRPYFKCATNKALQITTVNCTIDGLVVYRVIDV